MRFYIPVHDSLAVAVIQSLEVKKAEKSKHTLYHPQGKYIFIICDTLPCILKKGSLLPLRREKIRCSPGTLQLVASRKGAVDDHDEGCFKKRMRGQSVGPQNLCGHEK